MTIETLILRSTLVRYALISAINLVILLVGIAMGVLLAPHVETASAHPSGPPQATSAQTSPPPSAADNPQYEEITPGVTTGTMAVHTFLAHRIATDELMVNGYDVIALNEGIVNLLKNKGVATFRELDAVN